MMKNDKLATGRKELLVLYVRPVKKINHAKEEVLWIYQAGKIRAVHSQYTEMQMVLGLMIDIAPSKEKSWKISEEKNVPQTWDSNSILTWIIFH